MAASLNNGSRIYEAQIGIIVLFIAWPRRPRDAYFPPRSGLVQRWISDRRKNRLGAVRSGNGIYLFGGTGNTEGSDEVLFYDYYNGDSHSTHM